MVSIRAWPGKLSFPSLKKAIIVDTYKGQMRIRKWPRAAGLPKDPRQLERLAIFGLRARRTTSVEGAQMARAVAIAKGTGLYPRDIIMRAMSTGFYDIVIDGELVLKPKQPKVTPVSFQGVLLRKTATQPTPIATLVALTWPLPIIDTGGFWSPIAPAQITIPQHVEVIEIIAGVRATTGASGWLSLSIFNVTTGLTIAATVTTSIDNKGATVATGPIKVTPGETFEARIGTQQAGTVLVDASFFGATVVGAN